VRLLREWISRPDLGGGCGFIGRDLGPEYPTVYDTEFHEDLMVIVDRGGEDDGLTKLLTGPVFYTFDWIVRRFKVSGDILDCEILMICSSAPFPSRLVGMM
jgi:hypothetical protein